MSEIDLDFKYWCEASGPINHWQQKYGAVKIPAVVAATILQKYDIELDETDEYKYYRIIPGVDWPVEKYMFGFNSIETMNDILSTDGYIGYEKALKEMYDGNVDDSIYEAIELNKRPKQLLRILEFIIDRYENNFAFRNVTKNCYQSF